MANNIFVDKAGIWAIIELGVLPTFLVPVEGVFAKKIQSYYP